MMVRSVIGAFAVFALVACASSLRAQTIPPAASPPFDPPETQYTTGDDRDIEPDILRTLPVGPPHRAFLPPSADLSNLMPLPGNQGRLGSCAAWATGYAARSYYAAAFEGRDPRQQ